MRRGPARRSGLLKRRVATCGRDVGGFRGLTGAKVTRKVPHSFSRSPENVARVRRCLRGSPLVVKHEWTPKRSAVDVARGEEQKGVQHEDFPGGHPS